MTTEKVQILQRVIDILDCFTLEHPSLGVREIARTVGLSSSTTGRLMSAMKDLRILNQDPNNKMYSIGSRALTWAGIYTATSDLRAVALPVMVNLLEHTRETISLYVLEGKERVCIERLESPEPVRITARVGRRIPLYAGSAGKCMLAFMPEAKCEEILNQIVMTPLTQATIHDKDTLRKDLVNIRKEGCAVSYGEWILEASGVAAPIFNEFSTLVASITISGPGQRFTEEKIQGYKELAKEKAREISIKMGYTPR
ncbi:MAG: IclR family transcriptional regulator [Anaerolineaceae bacterium]